MITPQQIQEISFEKALFGGYDMDSVDNILEPLTQDYLTLYKENSVLKSKLRILVEKLEEYRRQESSMQNAILAAQKTSEQMVAEAEKKCAKLLREAEQTAANKAQNCSAQADAEEERLTAAKEASKQFLDGMEKRLKRQLELIDELRKAELTQEPAPAEPERRAFDFDRAPVEAAPQEKADALIEEIGLHIEEKLSQGTLGEIAAEEQPNLLDGNTRKMGELHAEIPSTTPKRFEDLQFGRNYHPNEKK